MKKYVCDGCGEAFYLIPWHHQGHRNSSSTFVESNWVVIEIPDPLASIAENLERLADIAEYQLRKTDRNFGTVMSVKDLLNDNRITITEGEGK